MKFPQKNKQKNQRNERRSSGINEKTNKRNELNGQRKNMNQKNIKIVTKANNKQNNNNFLNKKSRNHTDNNRLQQKDISFHHKNQQMQQQFDANDHIHQQDDNKQYMQLLEGSVSKGFKRQKNKYFLQSDKYKGTDKLQQEQQLQQQEYNQGAEQDFQQQQQPQLQQEQEEQNNNEIQHALKALKQKRHSTSKLLNQQISSLNQQDASHLKNIKQNKSRTSQQEYQQSIQLKALLSIYDKLVQLRYGQQSELQAIKQYPKIKEDLQEPQFPPVNHELFTSSRQLQNEMITNLSNYFNVYKTLATKCNLGNKKSNSHQEQVDSQKDEDQMNPDQKIEEQGTLDLQMLIQADNNDNAQEDATHSQRLNVDKIYDYITKSVFSINNQVQKQLIKWSQKTSFLSSNNSTSQLNSLLMQTPVGQAKKVLSNWQRMAHKCQQKRGQQPFKILFEDQENIHQISDPQIYDDYDLFIELQKYYLEKLNNQNEDNDFLQSATMKYLKNRQANQLQHEKKQKDVDRKASKNRKIRYNVHAKLLNFMPACQQNVIETRDQIVRNIFNCNAEANESYMQGNVSKYRSEQPHEETQFIEVQ